MQIRNPWKGQAKFSEMRSIRTAAKPIQNQNGNEKTNTISVQQQTTTVNKQKDVINDIVKLLERRRYANIS
jgi:hypothetical protein